jgi:hypothetical protein
MVRMGTHLCDSERSYLQIRLCHMPHLSLISPRIRPVHKPMPSLPSLTLRQQHIGLSPARKSFTPLSWPTSVLGHGFSLYPWGSAQNPRMNPCPSARPGEGVQEENRRGYRPVCSERSERRSGETDFALAGGARAEPSHPRPQQQRVAQRHPIFCARDGSPEGRDCTARFTTARFFPRKNARKTRKTVEESSPRVIIGSCKESASTGTGTKCDVSQV